MSSVEGATLSSSDSKIDFARRSEMKRRHFLNGLAALLVFGCIPGVGFSSRCLAEEAPFADSPMMRLLLERQRLELKRVPMLLQESTVSESVVEERHLLALNKEAGVTFDITAQWLDGSKQTTEGVWPKNQYGVFTSARGELPHAAIFAKEDLPSILDVALRQLFEKILADAPVALGAPESVQALQIADWDLRLGPDFVLSGGVVEGISFDSKLILIKRYPNGVNFPLLKVDVHYKLRFADEGVVHQDPAPHSSNVAAPGYHPALKGKVYQWELQSVSGW